MPGERFWCVEWHAELSSTMDRATELASSGARAGTVVVADVQTRGRGTHGRAWHAPPGTCLMFTVLARPNLALDRLTELPNRVATSVSGLLSDELHLSPVVKLPNDILVGGRKICGVLCSSRVTGTQLNWVLCGIGLNTWMSPGQLPLESATSLAIERCGDVPSHQELLEMILGRLEWLLEV